MAAAIAKKEMLLKMPRDVPTYLSAQQSDNDPELAEEWTELEELYNKKLWHQLTLRIQDFVKHPKLQIGDTLLNMYENFIADFENRINPLSLVEIMAFVIKQVENPNTSIDFLLKTLEKVKSNTEAVILCKTLIGQLKLLKQNDLEGTKKIIDEAETLFDSLDGITSVHGRFYELSSNYYRLIGKHADYYRDALRYLGCIELDEIPDDEKSERSFYLGLAALLGEGVFNFGELLAHPILNSFRGTDKEWLVDLLYTFNSGNLMKYEKLRPFWQDQPDLAASQLTLRQKISLLCLMEMTFKRSANNRQLTYTEIAAEAQLPEDEVELLVMKALSLGLVSGSIDQVDRKVHMTWIQPRVLDKEQISTMQQRLDQWCKDIQNMELLLEKKASDILT